MFKSNFILKNFFLSGFISGITENLFEKLYTKFGETLIDIFKKEEWDLLKESEIINEKILNKIIESWTKSKSFLEFHLLLYKCGLSNKSVKKLLKIYGNNSLKIIKDNPYITMKKIGIGFKTADQFAKECGISPEDEKRINAAFFFVIEQNRIYGNTYIDFEKCTENIISTCENIQNKTIIYETIKKLEIEKKIILIKNNNQTLIFLEHDLYCEKKIYKFLKEKNNQRIQIQFEIEIKNKILSSEQQLAVKNSLNNKIFLITGAAGTGKTTVLNEINEQIKLNKLSATFCAPTGRAAQRMKELILESTSTIHRLIGFKRMQKSLYEKIEFSPIITTNFLFIDEISMVDIYMLYSIFQSTSEKTSIIFIGDHNQLPPIACGNVLHEIIKKNIINFIELKNIFRQNEKSGIIEISKLVKDGIISKISNDENSECTFIYKKEKIDGIIFIKKTCEKYFDPIRKSPLIQIITFMNRGILGTLNLNKEIQLIYSKIRGIQKKIVYKFFLYDRVIQTKNNYEIGVFNGEIGTIIDGSEKHIIIQFADKRIKYSYKDSEELSLAYAITVHRSQGSEFKTILIPIFMEQYIIFNKNALYTAITRAKDKCIILGDYKALACAIGKDNAFSRKTYLSLLNN